MYDITDELLDKFGYKDLFANEIVHRAAEEIVELRRRVRELEAEVARLERLSYG
jgi:polyhydroxyalkanoate synthesis regulator phasin